MNPYFQKAGVTIYLADCNEVHSELNGNVIIDSIVSDPPYGMNWNSDYTRFTNGVAQSTKNNPIHGDSVPFDPSLWVGYDQCILWGVNHFANRVPVGTWLVWDKKRPNKRGKFLSDCEVAWMKGGHGIYLYSQVWDGFDREHERAEKRIHPTQKPVKLMEWCISRLKEPKHIFDPYLGSGSTAIASINKKIRFTGVEIVESFAEAAVKRIEKHMEQQRS